MRCKCRCSRRQEPASSFCPLCGARDITSSVVVDMWQQYRVDMQTASISGEESRHAAAYWMELVDVPGWFKVGLRGKKFYE